MRPLIETTSVPDSNIAWTQEGHIARVRISHPGRMNAITVTMWRQLAECFGEMARHPGLRVVEIAGTNDAFAAGADIHEFEQVRADVAQVRHYHEDIIAPALAAVAHCALPVVAAIDGPCVGGGLEIASVCDIRIASARSRFGIPILALGFPLAPREAEALVALVGPATALEILLEGRIFNAVEAMHRGLVQRVVPVDTWRQEVDATLGRICAAAPHAARRTKWIIRQLATGRGPDAMSPAEFDACWDFAETQDYRRGIAAFLGKTRPRFEDN